MIRFLAVLLFTSVALSADQTTFAVNQKYRLFGDQVNVRSEPQEKARVLAVLPIATEVTPVEEGRGEYSLKGLTAPWFKVKYTLRGKAAEGYVWGGLIAKGFREANGLVFLYGIAPRDPSGKEAGFSSLVRIAKGGKEIASAIAKEGVGFESSAELSLFGGRGFKGVSNIFVIHFQQEYCGGVGNKLFFFWTGQKLEHVHSSVDGADAPVYASERQVYPDEKGGKPGQFHIFREDGDLDNPSSVQKEDFWLRWTGSKLERVK